VNEDGFGILMMSWASHQNFREGWNGSWHLDPQLSELRIATVAPGVALLITPLLFTEGDPAFAASSFTVLKNLGELCKAAV
jgi:hypothetical protein